MDYLYYILAIIFFQYKFESYEKENTNSGWGCFYMIATIVMALIITVSIVLDFSQGLN